MTPVTYAPTTPATSAPVSPASAEEEPIRLIGEALGLYILVEKGDALIVIDKHAAHERIIFDRLVRAGGQVMSQTLLTPVPVRVSASSTCPQPAGRAAPGPRGCVDFRRRFFCGLSRCVPAPA